MLRIENLTAGYGERILIKRAGGNFRAGTLNALLGRNGTGKSTLLRILSGMEEPLDGDVMIEGESLRTIRPDELARKVAIVSTERIRVPNLKCRDVVALGRAPYTNWIGRMQAEDKELVMEALRMVGMESYAERPLDHLSDGESQRILIARALAQETPLLLLDEPTSFLDMPNRYELTGLLRELSRKMGKCVLFSTHELDIALSLADTIALIDTPQLHILPTEEMVASGHIERLFSNSTVRFDAPSGRIIVQQRSDNDGR